MELVTQALVLHAADYLESSRILRMLTRDAGMQSAVARGARSSRKRFGAALGLFAGGQAVLQMKPGRDLHTLSSFDVTDAHTDLALDLDRFAAASAVAELVQRLVVDDVADVAADIFDGVAAGLRLLGAASGSEIVPTTLGLLWRLVSTVGFRPELDNCVECHSPVPKDADLRFHAMAGGIICSNCASRIPGGRLLPASARAQLSEWLAGGSPVVEPMMARAHQRLLREYVMGHLAERRALRAYEAWETGAL